MKWIVTYRDKSGKRVQDCFDADSKQLLFPILKEKGISPISITELNGKFKPQGNTKTISFRLTKPLIYSVIGIIIISFVTVFLFSYSLEETTSLEIVSKPKEILKEVKNQEVRPSFSSPKTNNPPKVVEPQYVVVDGRRVYKSATNDVGKVVTNAFGKVMVIERVVTPSGPMKDGKSLTPRRIFKYDSEVAIDTLMNMDIGYKSLMMLPPNMDEDFKKSLSENIEILPEDTEDEVRRKQEMIELRKELAQRVAAGEKVSQIAAETLAHYNKIANMRETLMQEIIKGEEEGLVGDELEDLYEAANQMLKEYDALPIHSPKVRKAIIRERLERKRAKQMQ
jgi:hypothetical protein